MKSQGCLRLLAQGAIPIVKELDELLKMLGAIPQLDVEPQAPVQQIPQLSPELQQVFDAISFDSISFDSIVQKTKITPGLISGALLELELMGLVSQLPGMQYKRC